MAAGVVVGTNIASIHASRVLAKNQDALQSTMARLSSGTRLNSAADDAAATSVAAKMRADVRSTDVAVRNINDGISMFQTLDGAASEMENILVRMRELAVQMKNGTYADLVDRDAADVEYQALQEEMHRISINTKFNRIALADNTSTLTIQTGAAAADKIDLAALDLDDIYDDVAAGDLQSATNANTAIGVIDTAIAELAGHRATLGSNINRLAFSLSNAQNMSQRLKESLSGLADADYAAESAALARGMVLAQAGTAMLAQANQAPQYVLALLRV